MGTSGRDGGELMRQSAEAQQSVIIGGGVKSDALKFGRDGGRAVNEAILHLIQLV